MRVRGYIRIAVLTAVMVFTAAMAPAQTERYTYSVCYTLGFLKKHVGYADITLRTGPGGRFDATMRGSSIAWSGRVYSVSDTLQAVMTQGRGIIGITERVVRSIGWYSKPYEHQLRDGSYTPSDPSFYRTTAGAGRLDASDETMEAVRITVDMLGLFWFFRHMDFGRLRENVAYIVPVFGAEGESPIQHFRLTYRGSGTCSLDGREVSVEQVTFEYYNGGIPSGYPVECVVEKSTGLPLSFSAALKIGRFRMTLM